MRATTKSALPAVAVPSTDAQSALRKIAGLAIYNMNGAAKTFQRMSSLRHDLAPLLRLFSATEAKHGLSFVRLCRQEHWEPDRDFATAELGPLLSEIDNQHKRGSFDGLLMLQGFGFQAIADALYGPFSGDTATNLSLQPLFRKASSENQRIRGWIKAYLRMRFAKDGDGFFDLAGKVNAADKDFIGGTLKGLAPEFESLGLSNVRCDERVADLYDDIFEAVWD